MFFGAEANLRDAYPKVQPPIVAPRGRGPKPTVRTYEVSRDCVYPSGSSQGKNVSRIVGCRGRFWVCMLQLLLIFAADSVLLMLCILPFHVALKIMERYMTSSDANVRALVGGLGLVEPSVRDEYEHILVDVTSSPAIDKDPGRR